MIKVFGRLALIALLLFAGVSLWYGRVEKRLQGKNPVAKNEAVAPSVQQPLEPESAKIDYGIILTRNIFKATLESGVRPSGEQSQADLEDLAETKMQLVLLGTVVGREKDARAIIRDEKAKLEDIYHVGSEVHGAIITRIGRGKVVLQVNGREEVLNIKDLENGGSQIGRSPTADNPQPMMQTDGTSSRPVPVVVPQRRISFRNLTHSAQEPAAQESSTSVPDSRTSPPAGEPEKQGQPVPVDEMPPPGGGNDENASQQAQ